MITLTNSRRLFSLLFSERWYKSRQLKLLMSKTEKRKQFFFIYNLTMSLFLWIDAEKSEFSTRMLDTWGYNVGLLFQFKHSKSVTWNTLGDVLDRTHCRLEQKLTSTAMHNVCMAKPNTCSPCWAHSPIKPSKMLARWGRRMSFCLSSFKKSAYWNNAFAAQTRMLSGKCAANADTVASKKLKTAALKLRYESKRGYLKQTSL